ncbi:hypothetical protein [Polaromonas sp.]|uniref:hypothetical protein n=1 Tax=Polaromonas sp. TaxID=1869339 RepID=UPI003BAAC3F1
MVVYPRTMAFVDKISTCVDVEVDDREHWKVAFRDLSSGPTVDEERYKFGKIFERYKEAFWINVSTGCRCLVQFDPRKRGMDYARLEWNPRTVGNHSASQIARLLNDICPGVTTAQLAQGAQTRVDFSFDLLDLQIDALTVATELRRTVSGIWQTHTEYFPKGPINSIELGRRESDRSLRVYDKRLEQAKAQYGDSLDHRELYRLAMERRPITRVELTLRKGLDARQLVCSINPFLKYQFSHLAHSRGRMPGHEWKFFIDACKQRGSQAALSLIENKKLRKQYRDLLFQNPPSWWQPELIWQESLAAYSSIWSLPNPINV